MSELKALIIKKNQLLEQILKLTKEVQLDQTLDSTDVFVNLLNGRQPLLDKISEIEPLIKAQRYIIEKEPGLKELCKKTDEIITEIKRHDETIKVIGTGIINDIKKNMKTMAEQKAANLVYESGFMESRSFFDKMK